MSRKNKLSTRKNLHEYSLKRERAAQDKKEKKAANRQKAIAKSAAGVTKRPHKQKGIRIRKGAVVKGIKIVDADSKKRAKEAVASDALNKMDLDEWEEVPESEQA